MDNMHELEVKEFIKCALINMFESEQKAKKYYEQIEEYSANITAQHYGKIDYVGPIHWNKLQLEDIVQYGNAGAYNRVHNTTTLDKDRALNNIPGSTLTAIHEGAHLGQYHALQSIKQLTTMEEWLLGMNHECSGRDTLGIQTKGTIYIQGSLASQEYTFGSDMREFYHRLQFIERQAREITIKIGEQIGLDVQSKKNELTQMAWGLRHHLSRCDLTDEELFKVIDNAQYKIARGLQPENSLEARVMVDMSSLMFEQEAHHIYHKNKDLAHQQLTPNNVAERLDSYGFKNANVLSYRLGNESTYENVVNMSQTLRDESPAYMAYALANLGAEQIMPLINFESFNNWYFSENNFFNEQSCSSIAQTIGSSAYNRDVVDWAVNNNIDWNDIGVTQFYEPQEQQFDDIDRET